MQVYSVFLRNSKLLANCIWHIRFSDTVNCEVLFQVVEAEVVLCCASVRFTCCPDKTLEASVIDESSVITWSSSPGRVPGNAASTSCPPAPCLWRRPTSRARPLPPPAAAAGSGGSPAAPGVAAVKSTLHDTPWWRTLDGWSVLQSTGLDYGMVHGYYTCVHVPLWNWF